MLTVVNTRKTNKQILNELLSEEEKVMHKKLYEEYSKTMSYGKAFDKAREDVLKQRR